MSKLKHYITRLKQGALNNIIIQLKWLLQLSVRYKWSILLYTALGLSGTVTGLLSSFVSRDMVDLITGQRTGELLKTFLFMIFISFSTFCLSQIAVLISRKITLKVVTISIVIIYFYVRLYKKMMKM